MNSFELFTADDKLKVIAQFHYSQTLDDLKHYLDLTEYLRNYIHFYAQLVRSLQNLKTSLLKNASAKDNSRKICSSRTRLIESTTVESKSFKTLQAALFSSFNLAHCDLNKMLWVNLDAFKEFEFDAVVFHVKESTITTKWSSCIAVQLIMFLSRLLISVETNYWFTELEIASFVWVIKKIRHLVKSFVHSSIIQTNHSTILDIVKQKPIVFTTSTMRLNVRLIRVSQFLRQFRLNVRHKLEKDHIVLDVLSRLASKNHNASMNSNHLERNVLHIDVFVQMLKSFYDRIIVEYVQKDYWRRIIQQINENEKLDVNVVSLFFVHDNRLSLIEADSYF